MFSLHDLRLVLCSRDLDVLCVQRIMGFFTLITYIFTHQLHINEVGKSDHMDRVDHQIPMHTGIISSTWPNKMHPTNIIINFLNILRERGWENSSYLNCCRFSVSLSLDHLLFFQDVIKLFQEQRGFYLQDAMWGSLPRILGNCSLKMYSSSHQQKCVPPPPSLKKKKKIRYNPDNYCTFWLNCLSWYNLPSTLPL